jgi:predicted kinase
MKNIINIKILIGIPRSGKTSWSTNYVFENRNVTRINRDELRMMLVGNVITKGNNNFINKVRNNIIRQAIIAKRNIIIDDTNCYLDQLVVLIKYIKEIACKYQREVFIELVDFDTDIKICLERNDLRKNKIPISGIYHMLKAKDEIISNLNLLNIDNFVKIV